MSCKPGIARGEARRFTLTITDEATGEPMNLAGVKLWFTVKLSAADAVPLLLKRNAAAGGDVSQIEVPAPISPTGIAYVIFTQVDTVALDVRSYIADVWAQGSGDAEPYQILTPFQFPVTDAVKREFP